jgi:hypothetical protein
MDSKKKIFDLLPKRFLILKAITVLKAEKLIPKLEIDEIPYPEQDYSPEYKIQ